MSNSVTKISFGQIGNCPVVTGAGSSYILNLQTKRWKTLPECQKPDVIPIKPTTFLRRFGAVTDQLPPELRNLAPSLRLTTAEGKTVGFCRTTSSGYFEDGEGAGVSAQVIAFHPRFAKREREKVTFYLGRHHYSGGPGFSWSCEYQIVRLDNDGQLWDVQSSHEESDGFESMGTHSLEAAQEYFDSVGFQISSESWEAMGVKVSKEQEDECIICRRSLSVYVVRRGFHRCVTD